MRVCQFRHIPALGRVYQSNKGAPLIERGSIMAGGEGGIRTLETREGLRAFQARALGQAMRPLQL